MNIPKIVLPATFGLCIVSAANAYDLREYSFTCSVVMCEGTADCNAASLARSPHPSGPAA